MHLRLPLQQLHQLQHLHLSLHGSNVCSGSSSSSNPLVPLSGNLTALVLRDCTLQTSYCGPAAVTALTGLRRLQLAGAALQHLAADAGALTLFNNKQPAQPNILQHMTQLTALSLADTRCGTNWESSSGSRGGVAAALSIGALALGALHVISKLTALQ